ncbi:uncharacterized protein LOC132753221 isoform X2 [Ruditapes philippinarum]|uniref:uncharacterized protein LOC132753221 isoform X2 n=1 Tax=Ruditapes philippinarum TaxID=129788 RepID=UPI00295B49C5|nr:uncharacterized protein LOC132753221 isoform X2 [Ruditapes philippinarum]
MLSALHVCSSWRPPLTWCRMLYIKQQRLQSYSKFSKGNNDHEKQFESNSSRNERKFEQKSSRRNLDYERYFEPKSSRRNIGHERYFEPKSPRGSSDHQRYFEPKSPRGSSDHQRYFEPKSPRGSSDHQRYFEPKSPRGSSDHQRYFEPKSSRRNSDHEKYFEHNSSRRNSDHERYFEPKSIRRNSDHEKYFEPKSSRNSDHEKYFEPKFSRRNSDHEKYFESKSSRRNSDHEKYFEHNSSRRNSDHERYFEPKSSRRNSDHEKYFEHNSSRRNSDHERYFEPKSSRRNSDHEKYFEHNSSRRNSDHERYFEPKSSTRNSYHDNSFRRNVVRNDKEYPKRTDQNVYQEGKQPLRRKELLTYDNTEDEIEAEEMFKTEAESYHLRKDNRNLDSETHFETKSSAENLDYDRHIGPIYSKEKHSKKKKTVLPKDWSETFGTLLDENEQRKMEKSALVDNERYLEEMEKERKETAHIVNHVRLARYGRRHIPNWYARRIKTLGKEGKVREAIEVFETWMIKQDRVKPTGYEFSVIIDLLAQVGYIDKAFELYSLMGKLKIYIEDPIYTSLFNACANAPSNFQKEALKRIDSLHAKMLSHGRQPTYITRMAIIKAYGMNGDINKAFRVADEAFEMGASVDLMNNLLIACISDKEAGFRHAVVAWRKFRELGIKPKLASYKLLLHAVDVCGIGEPLLVDKVLGISGGHNHARSTDSIKAIEARSKGRKFEKEGERNVQAFKEIDSLLTKYNMTFESNQGIVDDGNEDINKNNYDIDDESVKREHNIKDDIAFDEKVEKETMINKEWWQMDIFEGNVNTEIARREEVAELYESHVDLPNILDPNERLASVIQVKQIKKPEHRLALIGGVKGILESLKKDNLKPDRRVFTYLAQSAPAHLEDEIIDEMWARGMKPDVFFYNILLKKRGAQHDKDSAWALYSRLKHEEVVPDMKTFTCISTACRTHTDSLKILEDIDNAELQPNKFIFTALLNTKKVWFVSMKEILCRMEELDIKADKLLVRIIEKQIHRAKERIVSMEKDGKEEDKMAIEKLKTNLSWFLKFYDEWALKNVLEVEQHPWKHFMPKQQ